jgi:hypothetical protein
MNLAANLAHPEVFVSDLHDFVKKINPNTAFRSTLKELEVMYIWRDDKKEKLFED